MSFQLTEIHNHESRWGQKAGMTMSQTVGTIFMSHRQEKRARDYQITEC